MKLFRTEKNIFADDAHLTEAIRVGDAQAIVFLQDQSIRYAKKLITEKNLPQHLTGEILNDASIILIKKLRTPGFTLHSAKVVTYFFEILKYVVLNKTRSRQYSGNESTDNILHAVDHDTEIYYARKEQREQVSQLLQQIGEPCSNILHLKYIMDYSDEEVVEQRLSPYQSVESLRVKRSGCLKKLRELVKY